MTDVAEALSLDENNRSPLPKASPSGGVGAFVDRDNIKTVLISFIIPTLNEEKVIEKILNL